jgi:ribosomal protein L37AE/L43A
MSFQGVCQVCEAAPADHSCEQCGALVCEKHFDEGIGVCVQCASRVRGGDDVRGGDVARDDYDVLR